LTGDEEVVLGGNPAVSRGIESPVGDYEMERGVELKVLIPGMQDGGEA
jgi:hypothetical protein